MKQGIIFDMDGTLWDSAEQVAASWTLALHQCGYADVIVTKEDMYRTMGRTMDKIAEMLFPFTQGKEREDLLATCCAVENDYLRQHGGKLYPGLRQTMETLQKAGYHLYIVSNCQSGYIEAFLDYFSFMTSLRISCALAIMASQREKISVYYMKKIIWILRFMWETSRETMMRPCRRDCLLSMQPMDLDRSIIR